jgi:signal transduction histidine kinase
MEMKGLISLIEIDPKLQQARVYTDMERFRQIFVNLLQNALKFTMKGFIKVSAYIVEEINIDLKSEDSK